MTLKFETDRSPRVVPTVDIDIDGEVYTVYRPKSAVWLRIVALAGDDDAVAAAGAITRFLSTCLDPADERQINRRVNDRTDNLDAPLLLEVIQGLIEYWKDDTSGEMKTLGLRIPTAEDAPKAKAKPKKPAARGR